MLELAVTAEEDGSLIDAPSGKAIEDYISFNT